MSVPTFVHLSRAHPVPDPVRIARYRRAPELGPRLLFFSGGSALRPLSRVLKLHTHNSIHLITPFDSGGSSARLRAAFGMLSVGDLRNRITALADETSRGNPAIYKLFSHRLAMDATGSALAAEISGLIDGRHALIADVPGPLARLIRSDLRRFERLMPPGFDLRGASIGNLILAGGFLRNDRDIDAVLFLVARLVEARGIVRPVVDADLHLEATFPDGSRIVGQHLLTGKEVPPLELPIQKLSLVDPRGAPVSPPELRPVCRDLIASADLVTYSMGSFYSSLIACLLPAGVGRALARLDSPKVFVPSTGWDPEQPGMTVADSVEVLLATLRADAGADVPTERLLNLILLDADATCYPRGIDRERLESLGVPLAFLRLAQAGGAREFDAQLLSETLLSLA